MEDVASISIISAIICGIIADKKNRSVGWGIIFGALFGILACIVYLCLDKKE